MPIDIVECAQNKSQQVKVEFLSLKDFEMIKRYTEITRQNSFSLKKVLQM